MIDQDTTKQNSAFVPIQRKIKECSAKCAIAIVALTPLSFSMITPLYAQDTRSAELASADNKLNRTYKVVMSKLSPEDKVLLKEAQRAWIAFRDLDCKLWDADKRDCLTGRTEDRERQLRCTYFSWQNGNYDNLSYLTKEFEEDC